MPTDDLELADKVDVAIDKYNSDENTTLLNKLPRTKYLKGREVVDAYKAWKTAKRNLEKVKAQQMLKASTRKGELSAEGDRKAWAMQTAEVEATEIGLIEADAAFKVAKMQYNAYEDLFLGVRKQADMIMKNWADADREAKYNNQHAIEDMPI